VVQGQPGGGGWSGAGIIQNDNVSTGFAQQVGIDAAGNCLRVLQQTNGARTAIFANRYTPGGGGSAAIVVAADSMFDIVTPQVAVNAGGDAQAVWLKRGAVVTTPWATHYTVAGGWEAGTALHANATSNASNPEIAMDANGNALAVWEELSNGSLYVWANRYVAGRGWGTAQMIGPNTGNSTNPQVGFDSSGRAIAVWEQIDAGSSFDIWADRFE
jgi:hypothetical protein